MAHCSNGPSGRPKKETEVTPRTRNLIVSAGVSAAGLALSTGIMTGHIEPDQATALATVAGTAITCIVLLRRPSPASADPDQGAPTSLEK